MKTITFEQWESADIIQRGKWLDEDVLLDQEGIEMLEVQVEHEELNIYP